MKRLTLLLASNNEHKFFEIRKTLYNCEIEVIRPNCIDLKLEVVEDGKTYIENSFKKAMSFYKATGFLCLADDSGLEVSALNNAPGIYSSRYAGSDATDNDRIEKVLGQLEDIPFYKRQAKFVSAMVLVGKNFTFNVSGFVNGYITYEPKGNNGFGYDPIFYLPDIKKTMAQLTTKQKNIISHRSNALKQMKEVIIKNLEKIKNEK